MGSIEIHAIQHAAWLHWAFAIRETHYATLAKCSSVSDGQTNLGLILYGEELGQFHAIFFDDANVSCGGKNSFLFSCQM
jgi:hypothetical protein